MWLEFAIAYIKDIIWDPSPLECLVLPDKQENIIRALAESQKVEASNPFDHFVKGKRQGLVILLQYRFYILVCLDFANVFCSGPPGVGKTLTAEDILEFLKRPPSTVYASDLNIDSSKLQTKLSSIFHLARHWNAVLLLDEANIFLEEAPLHYTNRNALVSVFLHQIEYFQGTMFLTTNRVQAFDEVFQGGIHFALGYKKGRWHCHRLKQ